MKNRIMRSIVWLLVTAMVATLCTSCGTAGSGNSATEKEAASDSSTTQEDAAPETAESSSSDSENLLDDVIIAKSASGQQITIYTYSKYMYLDSDYVEEGDSDALIDREYLLYHPQVMYTSDTSELVYDIYVSDASELLEQYSDEKYLDLYSVRLKLENDDIERDDDEVHAGITYRKLEYSDRAKDGTAYTVYTWIGVKGDFAITFRAVEYNGSDYYIAYEDMQEVAEAVMDSVIIK